MELRLPYRGWSPQRSLFRRPAPAHPNDSNLSHIYSSIRPLSMHRPFERKTVAVVTPPKEGRRELMKYLRPSESILEIPPGRPLDLDGNHLDRPRGLGSIWIIINEEGRPGLIGPPLFCNELVDTRCGLLHSSSERSVNSHGHHLACCLERVT